jgi:hypothetical protein
VAVLLTYAFCVQYYYKPAIDAGYPYLGWIVMGAILLIDYSAKLHTDSGME